MTDKNSLAKSVYTGEKASLLGMTSTAQQSMGHQAEINKTINFQGKQVDSQSLMA
jgi:hypothetical protein